PMPSRVLLDTNVYGEIIISPDLVRAIEFLNRKQAYIFYGMSLIRSELRATPRDKRSESGKVRLLMLTLYDALVRKTNRDLRITGLIEMIAQRYTAEYKRLGGSLAAHGVRADFQIVACASFHRLDIVVSHDQRSMLSHAAQGAYRSINREFELRTPMFKSYATFRTELMRDWRSISQNASLP
ncbi:MAG TPA: hypothetical protein VJB12_01880, partial [Candidatus Nanoarchaeia archaeon]|nr:hypothetical protein [Candidatus Nanoarchaeia archaeon]